MNENHNPWQCLLQAPHLWYEGRTKCEYNAKVMKCNKHTHSKASYAHVLLHNTPSQYLYFPQYGHSQLGQ